jgi:hypothetical protein
VLDVTFHIASKGDEMKIKQQRLYDNKNETMSILKHKEYEICWILEDQKQKQGVKVYGETRIPADTYKIELRTEGRLYERYKKQFGSWFVGMLHIINVPNFTFIQYHPGTDDDDTLGCPLPATKLVIGESITNEGSRIAFEKMYKYVIDACIEGNLYVEIVDN